MFKPQKPQGPQQPSRHKLPLTERAPKTEDISTLFTGALRIRGTLFELPIRPTPMSPIYIITCIFDHGCNETVWSMYEGSETSGPQLFSLPQSDLDMIFDMVCMACQPKGGTSMPAELSPNYGPDIVPAAQEPMIPSAPTQYAPNYGTGQFQAQQAQQQQQPYQQPYQQQQQPYNPQQAYPPQQHGGYPPQQGGYPAQQQGYPPPQGYPPQQQGYPPPQQGPYQPAGFTGPIDPGPEIPMPDFSMLDLLNKGSPNVLIGQLFVGSGVISQKGLDAALTLQEMVRGGKLTPEQSVLAMRRAAELGGNLDDDIIEWAKDPELKRKARPAQKPAAQQQAAAPAKDNVAAQRVVDLLKQAGLVTDEDLEMVKRVKQKHGGDVSQILVSAGKVSAKTVEAAGEVQNLVAVGKLRIDRAINALHYCERMRVGLKEACSELSIDLS